VTQQNLDQRPIQPSCLPFGLLCSIFRFHQQEILIVDRVARLPKQLSMACESVDNHDDGRSPRLDLARRGRAVPVARSLANEVLALRHQLNVRRTPKRVAISNIDRLVFAGLYYLAPEVLDAVEDLCSQSRRRHRVDRHVCGADDLVWASGAMCAEQGACVRRRSWAGYTINMFEFKFPTGQRSKARWSRRKYEAVENLHPVLKVGNLGKLILSNK
jgi:hypothetical protein